MDRNIKIEIKKVIEEKLKDFWEDKRGDRSIHACYLDSSYLKKYTEIFFSLFKSFCNENLRKNA